MNDQPAMLPCKPPGDGRTGAAPWRHFGLAIAAFAAMASSCLADVIEIAPGGGAVTYAAPAVFTPGTVTPIARSPPPAAATGDVSKLISQAAVRSQVSAELVAEVAWRESRLRQTAVSNRNAVGVMQLTAATARDLGVDRYDLSQNIDGGATYLRRMLDRYGGDTRLALAAYNAGPGAVDRYRGVPPFRETQAYVAAILARLAERGAVGMAPILFTP